MATITACIAAHPARFRNGKLQRALESVLAQERQPDEIVIINDIEGRSAAWTRQRVLDRVGTDRLAWLDSDDEWLPMHLRKCEEVMDATGAVFVYPWMTADSNDPLGHFGIPFNPATPHHTTITFMVETALAKEVGFAADYLTVTPERRHGGEDWLHIVGLCQLAVQRGLKMVHLAERTWRYHVDGNNTSGLPGQGDAR